jgi:hypothetical protein
VTITTPDPVTLSGLVSIGATATDEGGIAGVRFRVDGVDIGPEDTAAPYLQDWNSRGVPDGVHFIDAVARDGAGNTRTSAPRRVKTHNGPS